MRHPVVSTVHGQRVLHQIIRANAEKTHAPGQPVRHQRRRGNFNHHADFHLPMEGNARRIQFRLAFFQQLVGLLKLRDAADHGKHDAQMGVIRGGAQNRAQLRLEQRGQVQTQPNGAPAQKRIRLRLLVKRGRELVAAQIQRANHNAVGKIVPGHFGIGADLLFLVRLARVGQKEIFRAKEPDAARAPRQHRGNIAGRLNVGHQRHRMAVERGGGLVLQRIQPLPNALSAAGNAREFFFAGGRRMHHHHAAHAIQKQTVALAHPRAQVAHADNRRQLHRARHDGRMRRAAALFGCNPQKLVPVQPRQIRRRNVSGNQDARTVRRNRWLRGLAHQNPQHAAGHIANVRRALPQIIILHVLQGLGVALRGLMQNRFRVPLLRAQIVIDFLNEAGVIHHVQVGLKNPGAFAPKGAPHALLDVAQLAAGDNQRLLQTNQFAGNIGIGNGIIRNGGVTGLENTCGACGNSRRNTEAFEFKLRHVLHQRFSPRKTVVRTIGPAYPAPRRRPRRTHASAGAPRDCPQWSAAP